jgi:uncharacterized protein (DUF1330 family)
VIAKFATLEAAEACYRSSDYQAGWSMPRWRQSAT